MSFLYPNILWFLLLVPILAVLIVLAWRSSGQSWRKLISAQHMELVKPRSLWKTALSSSFSLLALVCIIIALARPINGYREGGATSTGRNLLIALDISRSMETEDVKPSRLDEARAAAYELINALPGDKIGLIVFSGEADLVVPLTYDHTALRDALEQVNRSWAGVGGTNFGLVLRKAMQDFKRSAPEGSTNALVILSDGEDTVNSSLEIAEEARESKLLVITVGIGTAAGGPIPDIKGENGLWQDSNGKHVISKLNTESLKNFAKATGGDFFVMDSNANLTAFTQAAVQKLDKHEEAFSLNKVPNDLFTPFAGAGLVLLVLSILTGAEWKRAKNIISLCICGVIISQQLYAAPQPEAAEAYSQGIAYMQAQEADKARESFSVALLDESPALQAAALYQLGQINATTTFNELRNLYGEPAADGLGEEEEAPKAQVTPEALQKIVDSLKQDLIPYQDALKLQPSLTQALTNISRIEQLIKKLEEEIERLKQQQNQNQQQQEQQNQDQQQNNQQNENQQDQQKDNQQNQEADKKDKNEQQNKSDKPEENPQQDPQKDKEGQQDNQDNQDNQSGQQDQQQQQQQQPDQQEDSQQQKEQQPQQAEKSPEEQQNQPDDEQKARQYAASVLRSHLDEEQGSPIPHADVQVRQPDKDY